MKPLFSISCFDTPPRAPSARSMRFGAWNERREAKPEELHLSGCATQGVYGQFDPEVPT